MEIIHCGYQFQFVLIFSVVKIKDNYFIEMLRSLNCAFIDGGFLVGPDTIKEKYIQFLKSKQPKNETNFYKVRRSGKGGGKKDKYFKKAYINRSYKSISNRKYGTQEQK